MSEEKQRGQKKKERNDRKNKGKKKERTESTEKKRRKRTKNKGGKKNNGASKNPLKNLDEEKLQVGKKLLEQNHITSPVLWKKTEDYGGRRKGSLGLDNASGWGINQGIP